MQSMCATATVAWLEIQVTSDTFIQWRALNYLNEHTLTNGNFSSGFFFCISMTGELEDDTHPNSKHNVLEYPKGWT